MSILSEEELNKIFEDELKKPKYGELKSKIQAKIQEYFSSIDLDNINEPGYKKDIQDRLYKMIDYAIKRYDDYSAQRLRYLTFGVSSIAISATFIGILFTNKGSLSILTLIFSFMSLFVMMCTGVRLILLYTDYITPDYPYRYFMDIKSWFHKYSINDEHAHKLSKDQKTAENQVKSAAQNYLVYIETWVDKCKEKNYFIKEDIEQVAILHFLQKFGRDSVSKMNGILVSGISIFIGLFIAAIISEVIHLIF